MYVDLQGKRLKKDWKDLIKKAKAEDPDDKSIGEEERLLITHEEPEIVDLSFNKADEEIFFAITNEYGYFSFNIPLDDDFMFEIVEHLKSKDKMIKKIFTCIGGVLNVILIIALILYPILVLEKSPFVYYWNMFKELWEVIKSSVFLDKIINIF